jgi:hypothetical protein
VVRGEKGGECGDERIVRTQASGLFKSGQALAQCDYTDSRYRSEVMPRKIFICGAKVRGAEVVDAKPEYFFYFRNKNSTLPLRLLEFAMTSFQSERGPFNSHCQLG